MDGAFVFASGASVLYGWREFQRSVGPADYVQHSCNVLCNEMSIHPHEYNGSFSSLFINAFFNPTRKTMNTLSDEKKNAFLVN